MDALDGLGGENHAGSQAAQPLEEGGGVREAQGGELVDEQQRPLPRIFPVGGIVGEVLDEEAHAAGGVLAEGDPVEGR